MRRSLHHVFTFALLAALPAMTGCSSIAKGVAQAVMEDKGPKEDTRACEIEGPSFTGIKQSLAAQAPSSPKVTKVLMVHGVNSHLPGYSSHLQKKLYETLALTRTDSAIKTIDLDSRDIKWNKDEPHKMGTLRISRHADATGQQELLFYELTWSPIVDDKKLQLAADSANNEGLKRASLNNSLKGFMNATVPDMLIYNGNGYDRITTAVKESVCWMLGNDWNALPDTGAHECRYWPGSTFKNLSLDDHFFITHSLGSRITIDTIQGFGNISPDKPRDDLFIMDEQIRREIRNKEFTVFMMANQLPLLQMGRDAPEVYNQEKSYCAPGGANVAQRLMRKMGIVAFSDPNDILSYPVPLDFTSKHIDSRICPAVTNVSINVAAQKDLFDAASFANPMTAHSGYMEDDRVIDMMANGVGSGISSPLIQQRCRWLEVTPFDAPARGPVQGDS